MTFAFNFTINENVNETKGESNKTKTSSLNPNEKEETDGDNDEPRNKRTKRGDDVKDENTDLSKAVEPSCHFEVLHWDSMITECIEDTEIETVTCGLTEAGEKIQLSCLNSTLVQTRLHSMNEVQADIVGQQGGVTAAAECQSDLVPSVYEGGLKVWECSLDLVQFLANGKLFEETNLESKTVLELGCGAGLPGIWCLHKAQAKSVHFQDFNREVILGFTMPNVIVNKADDEDEQFRDRSKFSAGDWKDMMKNVEEKFDLILASETIYNLDDLQKFYEALLHFLAPDGVALVASKEYYFGVGGGVDSFLELISKNGDKLKTKCSWIEQHGVKRALMELRFS